MSRILVTGAAGFIGYHLAKALADDGKQIVVVDNFKRGREDAEFTALIERANVEFIQMDLTDLAQTMRLPTDIEQIYHLAAINGTGNFYSIPDQVLRVNILTTLNILEYAKTRTKLKIVYTSSSEAYAGTIQQNPDLVPTKEDVPLCIEDVTNVRWSYGASKLLGECAMYAYGSKASFQFAVVRYHNIYGARMGFDHVIPQFMDRVQKGERPLKVYGTTQTRAFCYISDAVKATRLVMDKAETHGQIYHIGNSDEELEIQDVARRVLRSLGQPPEITALEAPAGSVVRRCPDTTKMKALGFVADVDFETGLKPMAEWYLKNRQSNPS